ncbi:MFS transporter [Pseudonocardia acaciae]|uniref:MFS transporter n=1 Tax=Pseudonocardia acaciae TaxID=551276 RepID=UPI0006890174|nr:MFS transporter [Pseudonocardia acaciae]
MTDALPTTEGATHAPPGQARRAALSGFLGTSMEWYDYFLYGSAAALVFPKLFFQGMPGGVATVVSLASFGVSFLFRPLGGVVFGHFGDRVGRKQMLVLTLLLMGGGSFLIGCLPTANAIGAAAPVLLVILRMVQGVALGGEWGGAAVVVVESAPTARRGLYASSMQMGVPAGQLGSAGMVALFALLPGDQFLAWGWRVPFLCSGVLVVVGLWVRARLAETPQFRALEARDEQERLPISEVLRTALRPVVLLIFVQFGATIAYYLFTVYVLVYVTDQLGLPRGWGLTGVLAGAALELITIPFWARLSDRIGRRPVYAIGTAFMGLFAFPFFWMLDTRSSAVIVLAVLVGLGIGHAPTAALNGSVYAEQFPARLRYTGSSLAYQASSVIAGAPAAVVAAALVNATGSAKGVSVYLAAGAIVSLVAVALLSETRKKELEL